MIIYLVKSTLLLGLFIGLYKLLLENEKTHLFNRFFLLLALIIGLMAPLLSFDLNSNPKVVGIEISQLQTLVNAPAKAVEQAIEPFSNPQVTKASSTSNSESTSHFGLLFTVQNIILGLYTLITVLLAIRFAHGLWQLRTNIVGGDKREIDGATLVFISQQISPQSFLNFIFLNKKDFDSGNIGAEVLEHELTHVRQMHSIDVFFIEALKVLLWFNPLLHLYKHAIQLNHEFLADEAVLNTGIDITQYQSALINTLGVNQNLTITSKFSSTVTKQRMRMMSRVRTPFLFYTKSILLTPLLLAMALLIGCEPSPVKSTEPSDRYVQLEISVMEREKLFVDEVEMSIDQLDIHLKKLPKAPDLVLLTVDRKAEFGFVTDIQRILKVHSTTSINYHSHENLESDEVDK
jgi:biopolymer transport protein ExbD